MPESATDTFSKKHEFIFFFVKQQKYYFDLDGIRDKIKSNFIERYKYNFTGQEGGKSANLKGDKSHLVPTTKIPQEQCEMYSSPRARQYREQKRDFEHSVNGGSIPDRAGANENGKNPGDVSDFWDMPTKPSSAKHYATYNSDLIDKPIIAGLSRRWDLSLTPSPEQAQH